MLRLVGPNPVGSSYVPRKISARGTRLRRRGPGPHPGALVALISTGLGLCVCASAQTCATVLAKRQPANQQITDAAKAKICSAIAQVAPSATFFNNDLLLVFLDPTNADGNSLRDPMVFWPRSLWRGRSPPCCG